MNNELTPLDIAANYYAKKFIKEVNNYRIDNKMTYEKLAEECEVSRNTLYSYLTNKTTKKTSIMFAYKISIALSIPLK